MESIYKLAGLAKSNDFCKCFTISAGTSELDFILFLFRTTVLPCRFCKWSPLSGASLVPDRCSQEMVFRLLK